MRLRHPVLHNRGSANLKLFWIFLARVGQGAHAPQTLFSPKLCCHQVTIFCNFLLDHYHLEKCQGLGSLFVLAVDILYFFLSFFLSPFLSFFLFLTVVCGTLFFLFLTVVCGTLIDSRLFFLSNR